MSVAIKSINNEIKKVTAKRTATRKISTKSKKNKSVMDNTENNEYLKMCQKNVYETKYI